MSKEIYDWLKAQKYQTEYEETGEYRMYFEVDMPKILEAYYEWKVKKLNKPAVSGSLPSDDIIREFSNKYAYNRYYEQENPFDTTVTDFEAGIKWLIGYIKGNDR